MKMNKGILSLVLIPALLAASACTSVQRVTTKADVKPFNRSNEFPGVAITVKDNAPETKGKKPEFLGKGFSALTYLIMFPIYISYVKLDADQSRQELISQSALQVLSDRKVPAYLKDVQPPVSDHANDFRMELSLKKLESYGTAQDSMFFLIGAYIGKLKLDIDAVMDCKLYAPGESKPVWSGEVKSGVSYFYSSLSATKPGSMFERAISVFLDASDFGKRYGAVMAAKAEKVYGEADAALAAGNYARARERYLYADSLVRDFNIEARLRAMRGLASVMKRTQEPPQTEEVKDLLARGKAAGKVADNDNERVAMVDYFKKAAELAPWDASIHFKLAASFEELKAYAAASGELKLYLALKDDPAENDKFRAKLAELEMQAAKS